MSNKHMLSSLRAIYLAHQTQPQPPISCVLTAADLGPSGVMFMFAAISEAKVDTADKCQATLALAFRRVAHTTNCAAGKPAGCRWQRWRSGRIHRPSLFLAKAYTKLQQQKEQSGTRQNATAPSQLQLHGSSEWKHKTCNNLSCNEYGPVSAESVDTLASRGVSPKAQRVPTWLSPARGEQVRHR